eukprot:scaffold25336_cov27-Tisochrysis_lutea.AAC.2
MGCGQLGLRLFGYEEGATLDVDKRATCSVDVVSPSVTSWTSLPPVLTILLRAVRPRRANQLKYTTATARMNAHAAMPNLRPADTKIPAGSASMNGMIETATIVTWGKFML